jgi:Ca-activated chloride channel family protein
MSLASPIFLSLLLALGGMLAWKILLRKKQKATLISPQFFYLRKVRTTLRAQTAWLPQALMVFGVAVMIVALARPQEASTKVKRNVEGIDIMIAFDISDSMLIEDMAPVNRLESAKDTIEKFIKGRKTDRIGLVVFSGESYTRVPLTLDYPLLLKSVSEVETSRNIKMGTAIGVALANAVARLKDSTAKSRVVIFLTDGENNSGTIDPETALDIAKGYGVKIYSIGIGRDGEAQLPVVIEDAFGRKIKRYRPMHSKVNEELLGRMASETGGRFWRATTTQSLQTVFQAIDRLEKSKVEVNQYTKYKELFQSVLKWGVMLFLLGFFLQAVAYRRNP